MEWKEETKIFLCPGMDSEMRLKRAFRRLLSLIKYRPKSEENSMMKWFTGALMKPERNRGQLQHFHEKGGSPITQQVPTKNLAEDKLEVLWDDGLRNKKIVVDHLSKHGDFKEYPSFKLPSGKPREIKHLKLLEPKKPELVTSLGRNQANVIKNENHHMVLYQTPDEKIVFDVVSRFDAAMRLSKRQPVIQQNSGKGQFIMSLVKGDTLLVPSNPENDQEEQYLLVESIWDSGQIVTKEIISKKS